MIDTSRAGERERQNDGEEEEEEERKEKSRERRREKRKKTREKEREKCAENSLGGDKGFTFYVTPHWMSDGTTSLPTGIFHLPGYWYTDDISLRAARAASTFDISA